MWLTLAVLCLFLGCTNETVLDEIETLQPPSTQQLCPPGEPLCVNANVEERQVCEILLIVKPIKGAPFVSARVFFGRDYTSSNTTEALALLVLERMDNWAGTESEPSVSSYKRFLAENGARISTYVDDDFVVTSVDVPSHRLESIWELFTDKILFSNLSDYNLEHAVRTVEQNFLSMCDDPTVVASYLGFMAYTGQAYDIDSAIDEYTDNLGQLDFAFVQNIWKELHVRRRMTVVLSGDVDTDEIEQLISDSFCSMPKGVKPVFEVTDERTEQISTVSSEIYPDTQTYSVYGYFSAPDPSHSDYPAFSIAISILSDKIYNVVRYESGLAYSTGARVEFSKRNYASIWFYSEDPLLSIQLMRQAIDEMRSGIISEYELTSAYNTAVTNTYSWSQGSSGQSWRLGIWELVGGNRLLADTLVQQMGEISADDITEVSRTWFGPFSIGVTGPDDISQALVDAFEIDN